MGALHAGATHPDPMDPVEVANLLVASSLLVASATGFVYKLWSSKPYSYVRSLISGTVNAIRSWGKASVEDELSAIVRGKMQNLIVEHVMYVCHVINFLMWPCTALMIYHIVTGETRTLTKWQTPAYLVLHGTTALVQLRPSILTWKSLDCMYGFMILTLGVFAAPWAFDPNSRALIMLGAMNVPVFLLNLARRSLRVILPLNLAYGALAGCTIFLNAEELGFPPWILVVVLLTWLMLAPLCASALEVRIQDTVRQGIECSAAKEEFNAASAMLRSCCDVVVEIDHEGTILSPALDLGSFLLRGPGHCLQYFKLTDLISHEADRKLFHAKLNAPRPSGIGLAEAIHVRMRDGNDNFLRVELLWFHFRHLDGHPHYMLGLREFSDVPAHDNQNADQYLQPSDGHVDGTTRSVSEDFEVTDTEGTSFNSMYGPPAVIAVDSHCAGLHIRECSAGFRYRIGRLAMGTCFAELVHRKHDFILWVQDSVNKVMNDEDSAPYKVIINMRQGQVQADCRMLRGQEDVGDSQDTLSSFDADNVRIQFFNIQGCQKKKVLRGTPCHHVTL